MTTRCGHLFHINCIDSWLNDGNQTCPRCRSMISRNELIHLYPETLPRLEGENVPLLGHTESLPSGTFPIETLPTAGAAVVQLPNMSCSEILCYFAGIAVFLFCLVMLINFAQYYTNNNNPFLKK